MKPLFFCFFILTSMLQGQAIDSLFYGNSKIIHKNPYDLEPRGYIAGTNNYGDIGKYQRFDVIEEITVVGAKIWMALAKIYQTPDTITVVFKKTATGKQNYDSLSGGPGETIASIKTILSAFDTSGKSTTFMVGKPFNVVGGPFSPESIFVGIEWTPATNDTFSLFADSAGQGEKAFRAWEQLNGAEYKYQRFDESSAYTWALDVDLWIALLYKQGLLAVRNELGEIPKQFHLEQNFPNPFNPTTNIQFSVTKGASVSLIVYDMLGKEVATLVNEYLEPGNYTSMFSARSLSSGMYYYRLQSGNNVETKKMVMMK